MNTQTTKTTAEFKSITLFYHQCVVCGHIMESKQVRPRQCWRCKTRYWDKPK